MKDDLLDIGLKNPVILPRSSFILCGGHSATRPVHGHRVAKNGTHDP